MHEQGLLLGNDSRGARHVTIGPSQRADRFLTDRFKGKESIDVDGEFHRK